MRNIMRIAVVLAFFFVGFSASAQTLKIGYIDMSELISVMPATKTAQADMEKKQADMQKEFDTMTQQLEALYTDYQSKEATYTDAMKKTKQQEIQSLQQRIEQFRQLAQQEISDTEDKLMKPIIEAATAAVNEVAKANGYTYVISKAAILYSAPTAEDLLPLVKKQLGIN